MWINYLIGAAVVIPAAAIIIRGIIKLKKGGAGCHGGGCASCPGCPHAGNGGGFAGTQK